MYLYYIGDEQLLSRGITVFSGVFKVSKLVTLLHLHYFSCSCRFGQMCKITCSFVKRLIKYLGCMLQFDYFYVWINVAMF